MQPLNYEQIRAMKGNGSSMRLVLKYFLDQGAEVYLMHEEPAPAERYFLVKYDGLMIPLRAAWLNFCSTFNSFLAQTITTNKARTHSVLTALQLPTPATVTYESSTAAHFLAAHKTVVVKPQKGSHGTGITTGVTTPEALETAVRRAQAVDQTVLLQQQVAGEDFRLLFIDYEFVAAVKRTPATITGDGEHTVRQLVEAANAAKRAAWAEMRDGQKADEESRGSISPTPLAEIVAARGEEFLETTPGKGETVQLLNKANVSLGGQTHDMTAAVNRELVAELSVLLRTIDLPLCGVDVLSADISSSPDSRTSFVIELNAAPGLRLHELPHSGQARPVCAQVADALLRRHRAIANFDKK